MAEILREHSDSLVPIKFPDTAFDLFLEESIINTYQDLLCTFSQLPVHEKQPFAQRYKQFINLAQTLEKKQTDLMEKRQTTYQEQLFDESFSQCCQRDWRKLIIILFGEEYLDDFQYRHAIATGEIRSVLTWRKLFSPIKVILVLVHSIHLALTVLRNHIMHRIFVPFLFEVIQSAKNFTEGCADKKALALCVLKVLGFCTVLYVLPATTFFILCMPYFISNFLYLIACPINKIIRPMAQYTNLSPYLVGPALLGLVGALGFFTVNFFPLLSGFASLFTVNNLFLVLVISCCIYNFVRTEDTSESLCSRRISAIVSPKFVRMTRLKLGRDTSCVRHALTPSEFMPVPPTNDFTA
ncbi:hypothetical protein [Rickettsiella endosymbiont of Dermanyssus gallinae]|uniref:hypothetical protein n=1 Tax=Rickettsiella endosymbiont of Dermanyssus gallinae TaxID=2856608 RepID=UPI001C528903|nr:hypothetical protein [Rickettsiella endosymbiont of Dermanyssus gallinae]